MMWDVLSDERSDPSFQLLMVITSPIFLGSESLGILATFYWLKFETPLPATWKDTFLYNFSPGRGSLRNITPA
jgi:hypothetical protein